MDVLVRADSVEVRHRSLDPDVHGAYDWPELSGCTERDDVVFCPISQGCVQRITLSGGGVSNSAQFYECGEAFPQGAADAWGEMYLLIEGCGEPVGLTLDATLPPRPVIDSLTLTPPDLATIAWSSLADFDSIATSVSGWLSGQTCLAPSTSPFTFVADPPHETGHSMRLSAVDGPQVNITRAGTVRVWHVRDAMLVSIARPENGSAPVTETFFLQSPTAQLLVDGVPWEPFATRGWAGVTVAPEGPMLSLRIELDTGGPSATLRFAQQASGDHVELYLDTDLFTADLPHVALANPVDLDGGDGLVHLTFGPTLVTGPTGTREVEVDVTAELGLVVVAPSR
jgi:hypothetical protein